jgi:hypothetical protein
MDYVNIANNQITVLSSNNGIRINYGSPAHDINHIKVSGNMIDGGTSCMVMSNATDVFVTGNHFLNSGKGVYIIANCSDYAVVYNKMKACTADVTDSVSDAGSTITGNINTA